MCVSGRDTHLTPSSGGTKEREACIRQVGSGRERPHPCMSELGLQRPAGEPWPRLSFVAIPKHQKVSGSTCIADKRVVSGGSCLTYSLQWVIFSAGPASPLPPVAQVLTDHLLLCLLYFPSGSRMTGIVVQWQRLTPSLYPCEKQVEDGVLLDTPMSRKRETIPCEGKFP